MLNRLSYLGIDDKFGCGCFCWAKTLTCFKSFFWCVSVFVFLLKTQVKPHVFVKCICACSLIQSKAGWSQQLKKMHSSAFMSISMDPIFLLYMTCSCHAGTYFECLLWYICDTSESPSVFPISSVSVLFMKLGNPSMFSRLFCPLWGIAEQTLQLCRQFKVA